MTIDKAMNTVAAADTVYIGAGVYREKAIVDTAGSLGSPITWIGDVDGEQTGDAGLVIVSAFDSDTGQVQRSSCIEITGALDPIYNVFRNFVFQGGSTACVDHQATGANSYEGVVFEDCRFLGGPDSSDRGFFLDYNAGAVPTGDGLRIRRCVFVSGGDAVYLRWDENATAQRDIDALVENCVFLMGTVNGRGVWWDLVSTSTFDLVGLVVANSLFISNHYGISVDNGSSTTSPVLAYNNLFLNCNSALIGTTTSDMITSDYNTFVGCNVPYTLVTQGANDRTNSDTTEVPPPLLGGLADLFHRVFGWSPWLPFEPIVASGMTPSLIGDASATYAPADDLYGNPRPMGPGTDNADDVGVVEARARPVQETTTVYSGSNAMVFEGAGFQDFLVPVAAQSTTITVYARKDATYAGTNPTLWVYNIPGVADKTDALSVAAGNWEQLSSGAFTPTSAGVCRVRLQSYDTSTAGECFFDQLEVS